MADHIRQQLVAAVQTRVTSLTTTGARVFGYRVNPLQPAELPGLCVYSLGDEAETVTIHPTPIYSREVEVHVVGYAALNATLDATLELIAKEVETALGTSLSVGGTSVQMRYAGCAKTLEAGEKQAGEIDLRFAASLANIANTPDVFS